MRANSLLGSIRTKLYSHSWNLISSCSDMASVEVLQARLRTHVKVVERNQGNREKWWKTKNQHW